ncbi:MAG TPA: Ig-like domain-containing protein [Allosphingosinicella sp.]|jgi:hypothetical protein
MYRVLAFGGLMIVSQLAVAHPQEWESLIDVEGVGAAATGSAIAAGSIDADAKPDLILLAHNANGLRYKVGLNLDAQGRAASWSSAIDAGSIGSGTVQSVTATLTNLDADTKPDLLVAAYLKDGATAGFSYKVGWNLDATGTAASWSTPTAVSGVGDPSTGAGAGLINLDSDARPEMILAGYATYAGARQFLYRIGWNLTEAGAATSWTDWRVVGGTVPAGRGVGLVVDDFNGNSRPDVLWLMHDTASDEFRYRLAHDLGSDAVPVSWTPLARVPGGGATSEGAGAATVDLDGNGRKELLVLGYDGAGTSRFRYRVGRDWDRRPPRLQVRHTPLNPTKEEAVTITASAADPDGIKQIEIMVDGNVVQTCTAPANGTCTFSAGPFTTREGQTVSYGANAADTADGRATTGHRLFAIGTPVVNGKTAKVIPLWYHGTAGQKADIVFAYDKSSYDGSIRTCQTSATDDEPNQSYQCGGGVQQFLRDVESVIQRSYVADEAVGANINRFNFWYLPEAGSADRVQGSCNLTAPATFKTDATFASGLPIVHTKPFRDCAKGRIFSSEPTSLRTFLHETGHGVFGLSDRYCCDGGYSQGSPWPHVYSSTANCQSDAGRQGWAVAGCSQIQRIKNGQTETVNWWANDRNDLMGSCLGGFPNCVPGGFNFDRPSRRRVVWVLDRY